VEVLGELRGDDFDFGGTRELPNVWSLPRMSGYERNWAVPGIDAGQYEDFVTATASSNFLHWTLRQPLDEELRERAERVVIWLGANDFRGNYGRLYDGDSGASLIAGLVNDLGRIIDHVKGRNGDLQIVVANVPDLGASPDKRAAHPDPEKRARVTAVTQAANAAIAQLAASKGVIVADVYKQTERLVQNVPRYFGAVEIFNAADADNNPRYQFTRDGLHPNTPAQIELARLIIRAFNEGYAAGIRQITDAEALDLLGIDPNQPYFDWLTELGLVKRGFKADPDRDGLPQLAEYAFHLNPTVADAAAWPVSAGGSIPGFPGESSITYAPDPTRSRHVRVRPQYSSDGVKWTAVPEANVLTNADGSFTAVIPPVGGEVQLRLKVALLPPLGSAAHFAVALPLP